MQASQSPPHYWPARNRAKVPPGGRGTPGSWGLDSSTVALRGVCCVGQRSRSDDIPNPQRHVEEAPCLSQTGKMTATTNARDPRAPPLPSSPLILARLPQPNGRMGVNGCTHGLMIRRAPMEELLNPRVMCPMSRGFCPKLSSSRSRSCRGQGAGGARQFWGLSLLPPVDRPSITPRIQSNGMIVGDELPTSEEVPEVIPSETFWPLVLVSSEVHQDRPLIVLPLGWSRRDAQRKSEAIDVERLPRIHREDGVLY